MEADDAVFYHDPASDWKSGPGRVVELVSFGRVKLAMHNYENIICVRAVFVDGIEHGEIAGINKAGEVICYDKVADCFYVTDEPEGMKTKEKRRIDIMRQEDF